MTVISTIIVVLSVCIGGDEDLALHRTAKCPPLLNPVFLIEANRLDITFSGNSRGSTEETPFRRWMRPQIILTTLPKRPSKRAFSVVWKPTCCSCCADLDLKMDGAKGDQSDRFHLVGCGGTFRFVSGLHFSELPTWHLGGGCYTVAMSSGKRTIE